MFTKWAAVYTDTSASHMSMLDITPNDLHAVRFKISNV